MALDIRRLAYAMGVLHITLVDYDCGHVCHMKRRTIMGMVSGYGYEGLLQ